MQLRIFEQDESSDLENRSAAIKRRGFGLGMYVCTAKCMLARLDKVGRRLPFNILIHGEEVHLSVE